MTRIWQLLDALDTYCCHPCVAGVGTSHTYQQLREEVDCWQAEFDRLNINAGVVVGIRAEFSFASISVLLALLAKGAIAALIPRTGDGTDYVADACVAKLLDVGIDGQCKWSTIVGSATHPLLEELRSSGDGGIVLFTSGSSGRPKAALQSTERFLRKFGKPGRRFRTLAFLLFDHVAGLDTLFYTLVSGGTLILARQRDPRSIVALIGSQKVEVLPTSPSFLRLLCTLRVTQEDDLSSLRIITYGSEPMDPSTLARLNMRFPGVQITQKYGTTETGSPRTVSRGNDSLWLKFNAEATETRIVNGVLWIRSDSTILGYLNAPSPLDRDGWYCTGDQVEVDGEWIRFCGRKSDTITVGGEKVAPVEVEQSILELEFVRDVVVTGEPDSLLGQVVTARVSLADGDLSQRDAARRIWQHCRRQLASYKAPVKVRFNSGGFLADRGKVLRGMPVEAKRVSNFEDPDT
jgi:acyl-coenzyme A synthetase/AMP-(fatty) acid ligase